MDHRNLFVSSACHLATPVSRLSTANANDTFTELLTAMSAWQQDKKTEVKEGEGCFGLD